MSIHFTDEEKKRIKELCLMFGSSMLVVDGQKVIVPLEKWKWEAELALDTHTQI